MINFNIFNQVISKDCWDEILTIDIDITERYKNWDPKLRLVKNAAKELLFFDSQIPTCKEQVEFLFVKSLDRADYDILFNTISDSCKQSKITVDIKPVRSKRIRLSGLMYLLKLFLPIYFHKNIKHRPFLERAFLLLRAAKINEIVQRISKLNYRHLVVFADMQPIDHGLVQLAKRRGIPSTTMQHGLYVDYENQRNINEVNYLLHNADNFLAWGDNTKELIKKHRPKANITICGKPVQLVPRKPEEKIIGVILDQNLYFEKNLEMLDIVYRFAAKSHFRVSPRLHPNNKKWRYKKFLDDPLTISSDIMSAQLAVGHTSTFIYELMSLGIPILRYATDAPALKTSRKLEFTNSISFSTTFDEISKSQFDFISEGKNYLSTMHNVSLQNYTDFFRDLSNNPERNHHSEKLRKK
ncbi:MAG: hypothetical protein V7708_08130 [Oceanicoccus sp.]